LSAVNINTLLRIPRNVFVVADIYGVNNRQLITHIIIPEAIPGLMLGIRLTLLVSWIALITAESSGVEQGLGSLLLFGRQLFDWEIVISTWGAIISAAAITDGIVSVIAQKAFRKIGE
jgi:sulfonate transport system permease protein